MNALDKLLATDAFYEGKSDNPVHDALGLSLPVIKLAHLSVCGIKLLDPGFVTAFTLEEQNTFERLLLKANEYLTQKGKKPLPLFRLSPRMLLPYSVAEVPALTSQDETERSPTTENDNLGSGTVVDKKVKKKLSRKQKLKLKEAQIPSETPSINASIDISSEFMAQSVESDVTSINEQHSKQLQQLSISSELPKSLLLKVDSILHTDILQLCQEYEDLLSRQREHWDSVSQSANLRLFIAEHENNDLKDKVKELQQQAAELSAHRRGDIN